MKSKCALLILVMIRAVESPAQTHVTTSGFRIQVNGQDLAFKGVNYAPVPIANHPQYAPTAITSPSPSVTSGPTTSESCERWA